MPTEGGQKYRKVAFLVYLTDENGNQRFTRDEVIQRLIKSYGAYAVSPVHQPDDEDTSLHLHVIYSHGNSTTGKFLREFLLAELGDIIYNRFLLFLHSPSVYERYLLHLDNPEKEQFPNGENEIELIGGYTINLRKELSFMEKLQIQMEIENFAIDYSIHEYSAMSLYLQKHAMFEHYYYFTTHTHHFGKFLDSLRHSAELQTPVDIDETIS